MTRRHTGALARKPTSCSARSFVGPLPISVTDNLPTARSMLPQTYLCLCVRCRAGCLHGGAADLQAIIDAGQGDKPIKDLKFRCTKCGSRRTDFVVMSRDAARVQPWRHEAG
jgi:hypothetical protein